jgi:TonB family protein
MRVIGNLKERSLFLALLFSFVLHGFLACFFIPPLFKYSERPGHPIEIVWETKDIQPHSPEPKTPLKQKERKVPPSNASLSPLKKVSARPPVALSHSFPSFHQKEKSGGESPGPSRHTPKRKTYHPLPSYPWICRKRGQEGVVALRVIINAEGRVTETIVHKSSGHTRLDEVALETLKSWTFAEDSCTKTLSIAFRLRG